MAKENMVLGIAVDKLALINAQIKDLQDQADVLKQVLIGSNMAVVEGEKYRAAIAFKEPKPAVDYKAVVAFIKPDEKILKKFLKVKAPYYAVSLSDR